MILLGVKILIFIIVIQVTRVLYNTPLGTTP